MFQSRNRESFLFKLSLLFSSNSNWACFNLVIENLFFSRQWSMRRWFMLMRFQSRNRESFLFKTTPRIIITAWIPVKFQSRNRESFLFKAQGGYCGYQMRNSFNLVIENLFFSSLLCLCGLPRLPSFNLVIENLFFSRLYVPHRLVVLGQVSIS